MRDGRKDLTPRHHREDPMYIGLGTLLVIIVLLLIIF